MTCGDGLATVSFFKLIPFCKTFGVVATLGETHTTARFGALSLDGYRVRALDEKLVAEAGQINGAFFVLSPSGFDYTDGCQVSWEMEPVRNLACEGQLKVFFYGGFWQPTYSLREKVLLEDLWMIGEALWQIWK
jgi:glucose-1-phosphate cytidylyltransferase